MHRSLRRDAYEAKMQFNPDRKAELLAKSPHRRHQLQVKEMLEQVERVKKVVADAQEGAA